MHSVCFQKEIPCCLLAGSLSSEHFFGNPTGTSLREWRWQG